MRIVSWNCNGKFREKYGLIEKCNADIYVIEECENPTLYHYDEKFVKNFFWIGKYPYKGLGIFAKESLKMTKNNWNADGLHNFLSVKIEDAFDLLGVWACHPYIEAYYDYQNRNLDNYNENTILIGDFNSNAQWDKKHGQKNHNNVVNALRRKGMVSAYHVTMNEEFGRESQNSFFRNRKLEKGFHIDYAFISAKRIKKFEISQDIKWLQYSDHLPLLLDLPF